MSLSTLTLEEKYPIGSRWTKDAEWLGSPEHKEYRVIGYDGNGIVTATTVNDWASGYTLHAPSSLDGCERIPDPPPCPITEPVTLEGYSDCWKAPMPHLVERFQRRITLYPPGAEIDAKRYVVCEVRPDLAGVVPAAREFILGTWGGAS
jgi:hypothetical protein